MQNIRGSDLPETYVMVVPQVHHCTSMVSHEDGLVKMKNLWFKIGYICHLLPQKLYGHTTMYWKKQKKIYYFLSKKYWISL